MQIGDVDLETLLDEVCRRLAIKVADEQREKMPQSLSWREGRIREIIDEAFVVRTIEFMDMPEFQPACADSEWPEERQITPDEAQMAIMAIHHLQSITPEWFRCGAGKATNRDYTRILAKLAIIAKGAAK